MTMAAPPLEIKGKTYPMTALTPVPRYRRIVLSFLMWVFTLPYFTLQFARNLMFIHFACWQPVHRDRFPRLSDEQPKENLKNDYFLFATNFNGSWDQYIDAFGLIRKVRRGLNAIWITSKDFPGAWPIRTFKQYIHYFEYELDYYYTAYPSMSVRDIASATTLTKSLDKFVATTNKIDSPGLFYEQFHNFVGSVASRLGDTGDEDQSHMIPRHMHARPQVLPR
jgi:hypothetical protein